MRCFGGKNSSYGKILAKDIIKKSIHLHGREAKLHVSFSFIAVPVRSHLQA